MLHASMKAGPISAACMKIEKHFSYICWEKVLGPHKKADLKMNSFHNKSKKLQLIHSVETLSKLVLLLKMEIPF